MTTAELHAAAVVAFVTAAGVLMFVTVHSAAREHAVAATAASPAQASQPVPRVSPSAMLGAARDEYHPGETPTVEGPAVEAPAAAAPGPTAVDPLAAPATAVPERRIQRAARPKPAARATIVVGLEPAGATPEAPVVIAAPAPPISVAPAAPPERAVALTASLAMCSGNFFSRTACEQRTRVQYCEGKWGQTPQCPAGVANDHGQ